MGRLARDLNWKGEGIGELLLALAIERCLLARQSVSGHALVVDAVVVQYYLDGGFEGGF